LEDYILKAKSLGLAQLGISDHLPWPKNEHPSWTMDCEQLPGYIAEVRQLQKKHAGFKLLMAVEADYYKGQEAATAQLLGTAEFDYVIGSVHVLNGWGIDGEEQIEEWKKRDVNDVWREYFQALRESAETGLFHIIGHCDVAKKFNFRPNQDMRGEMKSVAEAFAKNRVLAEINSSGLRKPCKELYPSLEFLKILREAGVGITLGSDAHQPGDVARDFGQSLDLARQAGYGALHRWAAPGIFEPVAF
jgi:histidinol-phosphatase (PHP family)